MLLQGLFFLGDWNATVIRGFSLFFIGKYTLVIQCRLVHSEYISQLGNEARHNASRSHWFNDFIHIKKITFKWVTTKNPWSYLDHVFIYPTVTSARSCNKVGHLFWFTILAQHETNDFILYIHSVHKHRGNSFQRQNYKMKLKQRSLNWINSMQVKKILFTNVFFSWSLSFLNM